MATASKHGLPRPKRIIVLGEIHKPLVINHYGHRYTLQYSSLKTTAQMRAHALEYKLGRKVLVREADNLKGAYGVYVGPKIDGPRARR